MEMSTVLALTICNGETVCPDLCAPEIPVLLWSRPLALVMALTSLRFGCYRREKHRLAISRQQLLPGIRRQTRCTECPVDGVCSVMSPYTSYSGCIKAVAPLSWGVLLPLLETENISTPPAS